MADSRKRKPVSRLKRKPGPKPVLKYKELLHKLETSRLERERKLKSVSRLEPSAKDQIVHNVKEALETLRHCKTIIAKRDGELRLARMAQESLQTQLNDCRDALDNYQEMYRIQLAELSACKEAIREYNQRAESEAMANETRRELYQGFLKQNEEMKQLAGFLRTSYIAEAMSGRHDGKTVAEIVIMHLRVERQIPGWVKLLFRWRVPKLDLPKPIRKSLDGLDEPEE